MTETHAVDAVARTNGRTPIFLKMETCTPVPSANIAVVSSAVCTICLVSFAPPNHFGNLANADTSWVFDATALV